MKLKNTTSMDDKWLHRVVARACTFWRQKIGVPFYKKHIREVSVRNRRSGFSGHANLDAYRIVCSMGRRDWVCPSGCTAWCGDKDCYRWEEISPEQRAYKAARLIAHEVGHLAVYFGERNHGRKQTRAGSCSAGGDEEFIDRLAIKFANELSGQA